MHLTIPVVCHVQVNNKGTLMLTGSIGDGVHENILWPDIPYITDQNGSKRKINHPYFLSLFNLPNTVKIKLNYSFALQIYTFK